MSELTPDEIEAIRAVGREAGRRAAREQGLPPKVTDGPTIERVAALLRDRDEKEEAA